MFRRCLRAWLVIAAGAGMLGACGREKKETSPLTGKATGQNLLLVTLDTTRADHIGCYGFARAATPTIDGLAKRGTLFEQAYSQAPLTMVSHTCMMTGLYPRQHGIRDNGVAALDASRPTLATIFKSNGYHTGAFVASYVLDSRFGLNAGFDTYDDDMGRYHVTAQAIEDPLLGQGPERPADAVTNNTLAWLDKNKAGQFFCWVHYYDPHPPYLPPPEFRKGFPHPYDGEIAFMDSQFKRIIDWLSAQKLADKTTIVVVGDHGEAFGEHVEQGHVMFLYETNLHVPMVFASSTLPAARRVSTPVEVTAIFPTILDLFGFDSPPGVKSSSLSVALAGQALPDQACYSESHALFDMLGYAEQRSLTTREWKYISSTRPELYDRKADPEERLNVLGEKPAVAKQMLTRLLDRFESWTPGQPKPVTQSAESRRALAALGYVSGGNQTSTEFLTPGLPDPKEQMAVILQWQEANRRMHVDQMADAIPLLVELTRSNPKLYAIYDMLGTAYLQLGRIDEAIKALEIGLKLEPKYPPMWISLGDALAQSGQLEKAIQHYVGSLAIDNTNAVVYYKLATVFGKLGRAQDSIKHLRYAIELRPGYLEALGELARQLDEQGASEEAIKTYREAVRVRPDDAPTHYDLGISLARANQAAGAAAELQKAIRLRADFGDECLNLGVSLALQGKTDPARRILEAASQVPSIAAEARFNLGVTLETMGQADQAIRQYEKAMTVAPEHAKAAEALYRLHLHNRAIGDVIRVLRQAAQAAPDNLKFTNMLATVLSTAQDEKFRDGQAALSMMQIACQKTNHQNPGLLGTLAAAYAETGDFKKAVDTARQAIEQATATNQPKVVEIVRPQLEAFLQNKPYRNPKY